VSLDRERFGGGTAFVTGGANGIGEGFARHLAAIGMRVIIADLDMSRAETVSASIRNRGGSVTLRELDVTDAEAVDRVAADVFEQFGSIELLVNNAGVENAGLIWEVTPQRWNRVIDINLNGIFHCLAAFVPRMLAVGKLACIANLSSVGGLTSAPLQSPYIVSKHAVLALTECLYQELSLIQAPIQVSAVLPYSVKSQIFRAAERDAPTSNPQAQAYFESMQRDNVETGLDPVEAAARMVARISRGDFWVWSDEQVGTAVAKRRSAQLAALTPPSAPRLPR
jgi:NAD(P)-dependent dehydrogenase (short-subunit alcohol dehydrogenase family)